jgi:hypothetical protein
LSTLWPTVNGIKMRLNASAAKVVPYMEQLQQRGKVILARPIQEYAEVRRAVDDHAVWWSTVVQAITRGFSGDLLQSRGAGAAVSFRQGPAAAALALQVQIRSDLALVAVALEFAQQALANEEAAPGPTP